ncbi:hypothetical protein [Marinomonas aquiplantarum]|uniref:Uncharacterized protein n=1 Tax=Marinomonas aquiplantarum TaxID=491951 RepID=A0A366D0B2_9GAMM|nr:hypothetical protein [Marinomonas aquiplantarum]RBO83481.1 hypothetical protein DFP76_104300 [Marinomonas aquiplantarum]
MDSRFYSIPEALRLLFGSDMLREVPSLRTKANSFLRNGLLTFKEDLIVHKKSKFIPETELDTLFNAMLLSSIFTDSKEVKAIFCEPEKRAQCAEVVKAMFTRQHSLAGIALSSSKTTTFVTCLEGDFDLRANRLPNPFKTLPQATLGSNGSLLRVLLAQAAVLEPMDSILMKYLDGEWLEAQALISQLDINLAGVAELKAEIDKKIHEAEEVDDLLDFMRGL